MTKPTAPNCLEQLLSIAREVEEGQLVGMQVYHDNWCAMNQGGVCNCNPEIKRVAPGDLIDDMGKKP